MFAVAAEPSAQVSWWMTWTSALSGVVIGFLLKAMFDARMEARRNAREDRLRFISEKMDTYAEFGARCTRATRLLDDLHDLKRQNDDAKARSDQLMAEHGEDVTGEQVPEIRDLAEEVEAISVRRGNVRARVEEHMQDTGRLASLLDLMAPMHVRTAVDRVARTLVNEEELDRREYRLAFSDFIRAARIDLGRDHDS